MHRFFIPTPAGYRVGQVLELPDEQAHQVRGVLRMRPGDRILVLDNLGQQYELALTRVERRSVVGEIERQAAVIAEPTVRLTLYQAWLKRDKFEWVLQKGTELGVSHFVPVATRRSVVQDTTVKPNKLTRWYKILTEAAEQCGRGRIPTLGNPLTFNDALADAAGSDLALLPWEAAAGRTMAQAVAERPSPGSAALFIGPEGGFAADEVALAERSGVLPVTLGPRILRAETAALASATLVLHELGQLQ